MLKNNQPAYHLKKPTDASREDMGSFQIAPRDISTGKHREIGTY